MPRQYRTDRPIALRRCRGWRCGFRGHRGVSRSGFTLVELLVVIGIIAVLAAILFPVFAQAREKGRQSYCLSNLQQMGRAMMFYTDDNDGFYPLTIARVGQRPVGFDSSWMNLLSPYLKSQSVFVDLSSGAPDQPLLNYGYAPTMRCRGYDSISLIVDPWGIALWEGIGGYAGSPLGWYHQEAPSWNEAQIARPPETVLICDHKFFDWGVMDQQMRYPAPRHIREANIQLPDGRVAPSGLINSVFADGHVRGMKHVLLWEILPNYTHHDGLTHDVFRHFWPYE